MNNIAGKRILFVAYNFYNYHIEIKNKLEELGGLVDMHEQVKYTIWYSIMLRIHVHNSYQRLLAHKIINAAKRNQYDYVLVLEIHQESFLFEELKALQPKAKFILYYWDSIKYADYRPFVKYFDKVFSFDIEDSKSNEGIEYLPLFFTDEYAEIRQKKTCIRYDLLQVASFSEERYQKIKKFIKTYNIDYKRVYIYYRATFGVYLLLWLKGYDMRFIGFRKKTQSEMAILYSRSKCILDFSKQQQSGLSMRTIESMGAGKKLITSNAYLINDPIYNPNNIYIMEENKSSNIRHFLNQEFVYTDTIEKYSIKNWCLNLFRP